MIPVEEIEKALAELPLVEKVKLFHALARDLANMPGISSDPKIAGGEPCIIRTRIPVWILVRARQLGTSEADLLRSYPTLEAEDLVNAWGYYRLHRPEIERQIHENESA